MVDFPAPLAPIRATTSPGRTSKETFFSGMDVAVVDVDVLNLQHRPCLLSSPRYASMTVGLALISSAAALGDDPAVVQHADALADAHDQIHVVLNEQHGDLEGIADAWRMLLHQLRRLGGVHARRRLVQQQQRGIR